MNWDAQRTSANTNSPNGKILRIVPRATPLGPPGVGTTYTIPTGNMFAPGTAQTLPEIYAMGFRNPFRIHVDPVTDWVFMGDYGPDAGSTSADRGPQGSVEFNIVKEPGFYGWPYCVRENVPYHDITYTSDAGAGTDNGLYNCAAPVNNSPNNTGLTNLPAAKPATMWMGYTETDVRFPDLGTGGAPTGGTVYRYDEDSDSTTKFPRFYDGQWFIGEWNNDWIKTATWNDAGLATGVSCFAICDGYISPMDIEFGPDGSMYVVEWGQGFAENNPDSGVYRVDYVQGSRLPIAQASVTPDGGPVPLDVTFSSAGSRDPDGTPITYAWDFGDGGTSTDPNPTHTYTTAGTYQARLTVTDESGATSTDSVTVNAGNTRPVVTIDIPENGKVADFGDTIPYEVSVADAEDGSTGSGISCDNVRIEFKLGHDTHAHELSSDTGCSGEFTLNGIAGHGIDANIFTVITAAYTDRGAGTAGPLTGTGEVILQPKLKQAEFYSTTGRTADGAPTGVGTPGVQLEATTDVGAGNAAAFIEDGDWISFNPYNLEDLDKVTFRVASGGAGGTIQLKFDDPNGPAFAETPNIAPTGGWQTWTDVTMDLPDTVPDGTHRLFVVFRNADGRRRPDEPQLVPVRRQGRRGHRAARGHRGRGARDGRRPARRGLRRRGDGRRGRGADLRVGLRRVRHDGGHLDRRGPDLHVPEPRHLHGDRDRHGRVRRPGLGERRGPRHAAAGAVPDRPGALGRVRRHIARHRALDRPAAGHGEPVLRLRRVAEPADRQRLDVRPGDLGEEPHRPARAGCGRVDGDREDHRAEPHRELPPGRPAAVERRRQLGLGPPDLRRLGQGRGVHLRERRAAAQRGGRQARRDPRRRAGHLLRAPALGRHGRDRVLLDRRPAVRARRAAGAAQRVRCQPADRAGRAVRPGPVGADGDLRLDPVRPGRVGRRRRDRDRRLRRHDARRPVGA